MNEEMQERMVEALETIASSLDDLSEVFRNTKDWKGEEPSILHVMANIMHKVYVSMPD